MQQMSPSNGSSTPRVPATRSDMFPHIPHSIPSSAIGIHNVVEPQLLLNGGMILLAEATPHNVTTISHSFNEIHHSAHRGVALGNAGGQEVVNIGPRHYDVESSSFLGAYVTPAPDPLHESNTALAVPPRGNEQVVTVVPPITVGAFPALGNCQTLQEILGPGEIDERLVMSLRFLILRFSFFFFYLFPLVLLFASII
jgi:hypothetical protein